MISLRTKMTIESRNPATGELLATFDPLTDAEVQERLERADRAFRSWRLVPLAERARLLERLADVLDRESGRLARVMTLEMGKLLRDAAAEAAKCARGCRHYAQHGAALLA